MPDASSTPGFAPADWLIFGGYFLLLLLSGWWFGRREQQGTSDYFLAKRQMPVWAVAISVVATATSAATFIGAPEEAYRGTLAYLSTNIGGLIAVAVVAIFFIPAYYRANVTTVYELLEHRFGPKAKLAASWTFLIGRVLASGARLYIAAIPASLILFRTVSTDTLLIAIAVLSVVAVLYTIAGGIRSIIWTDAIQTIVFVGAAATALVLLLRSIPLSLPEIWSVLASARAGDVPKLTAVPLGLSFDRPGWGFDPSQTYSLLTAVTGFALLLIASYGTDHDLTQRMLTCRSAARGSASAVLAIVINLPIVALFMSIGLLLYIYYQRPDVMGPAAPTAAPPPGREVFLAFILGQMPAGLSGLMMAGLFAAGLGSMNSALNAMAAALVNDWYKPRTPGRDERHYVRMGRLAVAMWGLVLGLFACLCVFWQKNSGQTLIQFALNVMTFAYAGLLGVYFTAIFTRRGSSASAVASLLVGMLVVGAMQPAVWKTWAGVVPLHTRFGGTLGDVPIAFPWVLVIASATAFAVCVAGKPTKQSDAHTAS